MADVTIFKSASVTVSVIDGAPPVDQSAEVAALTEQVASLSLTITNLRAQIAAAQAALA